MIAAVLFFYKLSFFLYSQHPISSKNLIGLNRARRPHNAIFVSFVDSVVPMECLEAATVNWKRVCQKENDKRVEEQLRKVCAQLQAKHSLICFVTFRRGSEMARQSENSG